MLKTFFKKSIITLMLLTGVFMAFSGNVFAQYDSLIEGVNTSASTSSYGTSTGAKIKQKEAELEELIETLNTEQPKLTNLELKHKSPPSLTTLENLLKEYKESFSEYTQSLEEIEEALKDEDNFDFSLDDYKIFLEKLKIYNISKPNEIQEKIDTSQELQTNIEKQQKIVNQILYEIEELEYEIAQLNLELDPENKSLQEQVEREEIDVLKRAEVEYEEYCVNKETPDPAICEEIQNEINRAKDLENKFTMQSSLKETTFDVTTNLSLTPDGGQDQNYFNDTDENPPIIRFILAIINYLTLIIGTIAVLLIIIGGFVLMASTGDENAIEKGRDIIKYAIIGLIVTFFSYMIVIFVQGIFT